MANLADKDGVYLARFRYRGREYKKSLKTRDAAAARAGVNIVELTIHRLLTGRLQIPADVDPGVFIVSGGTWTPSCEASEPPPAATSMRAAVASYLASYLASREIDVPVAVHNPPLDRRAVAGSSELARTWQECEQAKSIANENLKGMILFPHVRRVLYRV